MVTLHAISRTVFVVGTGLALTFGFTTAAAGARIPNTPPAEPTLECQESGGWASCGTQAACAYACRYYGFPSGISACNVSTRCCYCGS
ncbi:MAG TPA: hypothetical protein VGC13_30545 [Longimicrobium sp.]|jgi:hypothetical protein|uniref:hypothetical protein n=1 Tax=Longimicrobium sp. TaxID=2029185 RepID=UPI002EDA149D